MQITGYSDKWSVRPGEEIAFHVHCAAKTFQAELVRLIHGDESPLGPGRKQLRVPSGIDGNYPGTARKIHKGSFASVDLDGLLHGIDGYTISLWIWPTLPGPGDQGLISWLDSGTGPGLGVFISPDGRILCRHSGGKVLGSSHPLALREWYHLTITVATGKLSLRVTSGRWQPTFAEPEVVSAPLAAAIAPLEGQLLLIAAGWRDGAGAGAVFNGKIAQPRFEAAGQAIAAWDFGLEMQTSVMRDTVGGRHGHLHNRPTRAVTGPGRPGDATSTAAGQATHDAMHFHDDDVGDAGWPESFRLTIPTDLPSGVYAVRLTADAAEDHLPFFVCPPASGDRPRLAVLMPTMSYLAYANESLDVSAGVQLSPRQNMKLNAAAYAYVAENGLKSTYDLHRDGSGICYGSRRRPIIDFRPNSRCRTFDAPHQFAADLYLIDWLTEKGYDFDVITDDLLHDEGRQLLERYKVVITGSHPEYWTAPMLDARDAWLDDGGRLMYLGGNGFYWVTGVAPDQADLIEIRRYAGTRTYSGDIGEESLSTTGERGGLWRDRGRPPQARLGIGFSGQGFDRGAFYRRTAESASPRWSWIFEGADSDIIGAGTALVLGHGAAGFEVDCTSGLYGTPPHTVVLASTERFTDAYQGTIENRNSLDPWSGGSDSRSGVRSDIVLTPGPKGGAVFAAGSITWSSTLSALGYDGDTSRITANVLNAFLDADRTFI